MPVATGTRLVTLVVRMAQIIDCVVVIGLTAGFIKYAMKKEAPLKELAPFFYNIGMASLAMLFAVIWALPFSSNFQNWGVDVGVALVWAGALGWLWIIRKDFCGGGNLKDIPSDLKVFWNNVDETNDTKILPGNYCTKLQTNNVLVIIGIVLLIVTAIVSCVGLRQTGGGKGGKVGKVGKGGKRGGRRHR